MSNGQIPLPPIPLPAPATTLPATLPTAPKQPTYHYINADHTLVMRDDTVIAWDAANDMPFAGPQSAAPQDQVRKIQEGGPPVGEIKIWRDAGSPKPTETTAVNPFANGLDPTQMRGMPPATAFIEPQMQIPIEANLRIQHGLNALVGPLEKIKQSLDGMKDDDAAGVKGQLQDLVAALLKMADVEKLEIEEPHLASGEVK